MMADRLRISAANARALSETEAKFRDLASTMPDVAYQWVQHPDGRRGFTYISPHCEQLFELPVEAILASERLLHIHPGDLERWTAGFEEAVANLTALRVEARSMLPSGKVRWWLQLGRCKLENDGRLVMNGVFVDQTLHRTLEQKLASEHDHLDAILQSMVDGVLTMDVEGRILSLNRAGEGVFGWSAAQVIGKSVDVLVPSSFIGKHIDYMRSYLAGAPSRVVGKGREVLGRRRDGSVFPMDLAVSRMATPGGEPVFVGVFRDISLRKQVEIELLHAKSQAEQANRAKSEFLANMSHELRTPLNAIIGFSQVVNQELFGPMGNARYKEYIADIMASGEHLLGIINDILDMSKIESGRFELFEENIALGKVIEECLTMLRVRAHERHVHLDFEVPPELPRLSADRRAVKQVLINILSNAVKFTPTGGRVSVTARLPDNGGLAVTVADTGVGIPEEALSRIFEPFQQADSRIARKHEGTGLGLSITRSLVELHGGTIEIASKVGEGTQVTIRFPAIRSIV